MQQDDQSGPTDSDLKSQKEELRRSYFRIRREVSGLERITDAQKVQHHLEKFVTENQITTVFGYLSTTSEISIDGFLMFCVRSRIKVAVPVTRGQTMTMARFDPGSDKLIKGEFGMRESEKEGKPEYQPEPHAKIMACLPGVAFDRSGARLGRGAGHYDRFLQNWDRIIRIGVGFECQLSPDSIPSEPHDQRMHFLANPSGIMACKPR